MPETTVTRTELGCPGHFVGARSCRWRRHTQIGGAFRVSTVGDYFPASGGSRDTLGSGVADYFETMVFRTNGATDDGNEGCGCVQVASWDGLEQERYATAGEAQVGHERWVALYVAKAEGRA